LSKKSSTLAQKQAGILRVMPQLKWTALDELERPEEFFVPAEMVTKTGN